MPKVIARKLFIFFKVQAAIIDWPSSWFWYYNQIQFKNHNIPLNFKQSLKLTLPNLVLAFSQYKHIAYSWILKKMEDKYWHGLIKSFNNQLNFQSACIS